MPRYDDRHGTTRLYVGRLSARTRSRDLEDIFSRYGRVRDVDMKRDYAFVEFSDPRDADDARYSLNGREVDGSRIIVEAAKGVPRGPGGSRDRDRGDRGDYPGGRGPPPGTGRCFNCGIDGHWARDCKAGDWKNKCYRCGERGHIERNCQNSPQKLNDSRSPSPRRDRRDRSFSRSRSYSRSRSPVRRERSIDLEERRSRSPKHQRVVSPPPSRGRNRSPTPERSPRERGTPSPRDGRAANGSEYSRSPVARNRSPKGVAERDDDMRDRSPVQANGRGRSPSRSRSPIARDGSPADGYENNGSPRGSE